MPIRERILTMGVTGSGKSYQWLKIAKALLPTGEKFRCIDTDDDISYMMQTNFPELMPENGGNVHVQLALDWEQYYESMQWVLKEDKPGDWIILDRADEAWSTVQRYFIAEVFGKDIGQYFLEARKTLRARGDLDKKGKPAKTVMPDALKGWMDWPVINKLYEDWILPLVYRTKGHVYATTKVQKLSEDEDPDTKAVFGSYGVRPSGQKNLGHQMHSIFLMVPVLSSHSPDEWLITTFKDRANRRYFKRTKLSSFYVQYLVAKAGWEMGG